MRRGGRGGGAEGPPGDALRQRSSDSLDSDDEGALMRLAGALNSLERTAAAERGGAGGGSSSSLASPARANMFESVAQEGHHSLWHRMDVGEQLHQQPRRPHTPELGERRVSSSPPSAAAAAAAFAMGVMPEDPAQASHSRQAESGGGSFRLTVQVADGKAPELRFGPQDDLEGLVWAFVADNKLKDVFGEPLVRRAEAMLRDGIQQDSVDIVELFE